MSRRDAARTDARELAEGAPVSTGAAVGAILGVALLLVGFVVAAQVEPIETPGAFDSTETSFNWPLFVPFACTGVLCLVLAAICSSIVAELRRDRHP